MSIELTKCESDLEIFQDRYDIVASATVELKNSGDDREPVVLFLHPELRPVAVRLDEAATELGFDESVEESPFSICGLVRRIAVDTCIAPGEAARLRIDYRGWVNRSGLRDNSDRYIGMWERKAFLRGHLSTPWFPCPQCDWVGNESVCNFVTTLTVPEDLHAITCGRKIQESIAEGRRVTKWSTGRAVTPSSPLVLIDAWEATRIGGVVVYHLARTESVEAAKALASACSKLKTFFDDNYTEDASGGQYSIVELDVPSGGYAAQGLMALASGSFSLILRQDMRYSALTWIAHEMVHEYVSVPVESGSRGAPILYDGLPLFFNVPALLQTEGKHYEDWVLRRAWEAYGRGVAGGSDNEGPLPPEKPIVDIGADEYSKYKDRFLMSDKLVIVLHRLMEQMGREAFLSTFRSFLLEHRQKSASYESLKEAFNPSQDCERSRFFHRWLETIEPLPQDWKPRQIV